MGPKRVPPETRRPEERANRGKGSSDAILSEPEHWRGAERATAVGRGTPPPLRPPAQRLTSHMTEEQSA